MTPSKCRSCGAPIRWVVSVKGVPQPLDFEPNPAGPLVIDLKSVVRDGHTIHEERARKFEDLFDHGVERFMPHHATCPQAEKWRRK